MAGIPLDEAELIAIFLETFLYGIFFTLFCITLWVLLKKRPDAGRSCILIAALIFMLILSTAHIIIDFVRIFEAFIFSRGAASGGPSEYYARLSQPLNVTKSILFTTMSLTGDLVMAWRCYVVHNRSRLVVFTPIVLLAASAFCGYAAIMVFSNAPIGSTIFVTAAPWISSFFILTLCTNTYCTGSIVYQIRRSMQSFEPRHPGQQGLMPVVVALIESGGLHATAWLALLFTYISDSNGQYVVVDTITPIVGIVFCLIIIRINTFVSEVSKSIHTTQPASVRHRSYSYPNGYPMHPVDITVTTHRAVFVDETPSGEFSINDGVPKQTKDRANIERDML